MRRVFIVVILIVAAAVLGLWRTNGGVRQGLSKAIGMSNESMQGEARDEINKSFQLQPGARVEVRNINGSVEVQTSDTKTAEVYVLRTGDSREALSRREVYFEQVNNGLVIRGQSARRLGFWEHLFGHNPNEQVTIKAPRQIALLLAGINGHVTSGDIEGALEARGINGKLELGQAGRSIEIGGVNGNIAVGVKQLSETGARFSGVNGNIELRLSKDLNADLTARGMNGNFRSDIPEITVEKEEHASRYTARIGNGGAPITISGLNGNVRLMRAESSAAATPAKDQKSAGPNQKEGKSSEK
jgi:hypothetical protein